MKDSPPKPRNATIMASLVRALKWNSRRGLLGCFVATVTTASSHAADSSVESSTKFRLSLPPLQPDFKRLYLIRHYLILIAALQGDVTTASDVKQGNTCINVLDLGPDGSCIVRALDVRDHLRELQTTGRS